MKKTICVLLAVVMALSLAACGAGNAKQTAAPTGTEQAFEWTRAGYFQDENENLLSVTWMEEVDEPGWYVGVMLGELMVGGMLPLEETRSMAA